MDTRLLNMPETRENQRYKPNMPVQRLQMLHHARLALQKIHEEEKKTQKTKPKKSEKSSSSFSRSPWLTPYESKNPNYPAARSVIDKSYPNTPYTERYDFYDKDGLFEAKKAKRRGRNNNRLPLQDKKSLEKEQHVIPKTSMPTKTQALRKNYWFDDRKKVKKIAPIGSKGTFFGLSGY